MSLQIWLPFNKSYQNYGFGRLYSWTRLPKFHELGKVTYSCCSHDGITAPIIINTADFVETATQSGTYTISAWVKSNVVWSNLPDVGEIRAFYFGDTDTLATKSLRGLTFCKTDTKSVSSSFTNKVALDFGNSNYIRVSTDNIDTQDGKWHHIILHFTNNKYLLWVDGIQIIKDQDAITLTDNQKKSCANKLVFNTQFHDFNDFRFYDHALSKKEIKELSSGLCLSYKFNSADLENIHSHIPDDSGYTNAGIPTNITSQTNTSIGNASGLFNTDISQESHIQSLRPEFLTEAITVNCWAYKDNWQELVVDATDDLKNHEKLVSCTQGGGWSFGWRGSGQPEPGYEYSPNIWFGIHKRDTQYDNCSVSIATLEPGWHMFTGKFSNIDKKITVYIDGALKKQLEVTQAQINYASKAKTNVQIGAEPGTGTIVDGNYFRGAVADLQIYSTALSDADINSLYTSRENIDKSGNLYSNMLDEAKTSISFTKTGIINCSNIIEGFNKTSLQNAYVLLDYIKLAGNKNQYIDTGYIPSRNTKVQLKVVLNNSLNNQGIYGGQIDSKDTSLRLFLASDKLYIAHGGNRRDQAHTLTLNTIYEIEHTHEDFLISNGNTASSYTTSHGNDYQETTLTLGRCNGFGTDYYLTGKLYSCKIWTGDTLERYLIPVKRKKDSAIGMLDLMHNNFYTNLGIGSFEPHTELTEQYTIYTNQLKEI